MPNVHLHRRDGSGGLSTSTIIIIAVVVGAVVILALALFAWRLLARCCRSSTSRKVPLPPVQDLAHRREHQANAYADRKSERPGTWADPDLLHPHVYSKGGLSGHGSSTSLIRGGPDYSSRGPTRESSWALDDVSRGSSPYPLSTDSLPPPAPPFMPSAANSHNSMSSMGSSEPESLPDSPLDVPMAASPSEMTHSAESSTSPSPNDIPAARPRPPRSSSSRVRQMSVASSSVNSLHLPGTPNVLRGAPHSIHSNINIVLPAPLAPEVYQHPLADTMSMSDAQSMFSVSVAHSAVSDRRSVADQWLLAGTRPPSTPRVETLRSGQGTGSPKPNYPAPRHSTSSARARSQLSRVSSHSSMREDNAHRRAASQPPGQNAGSMPISPPRHSRAPSFDQERPGTQTLPSARSRSPSPASSRHSRSNSRELGPGGMRTSVSFPPAEQVETVFQPRSPMPPVPRIPSMYGREQVPGRATDSYLPPQGPPKPQPWTQPGFPPERRSQVPHPPHPQGVAVEQRGRAEIAVSLSSASVPSSAQSGDVGPPAPGKQRGKLRKSNSRMGEAF